MPPFTHRVTLLALLALAAGCSDSPAGPPPPVVLRPGTLATGTITSLRDTARYDLDLSGGSDAVVYFLVKGDQLRLEVHDAGGSPVTATSDANNSGQPQKRFTTIIPASPSRYRVDVSSAASDAASAYEIRVVATSNAPEHVGPVLPVGTIVTGEELAHRMDVDSFAVNPTQTQLVSLYVRKTKPGPATLSVRGYDPAYFDPVDLTVSETDTVLGTAASRPFSLGAGTRWLFRVGYGTTAPDSGSTPYEIELRPIDAAPETAAAALTPGDTVSESIDYPRDIDNFTLSGAPGAHFNIFAQAVGEAPHTIALNVYDASPSPVSLAALGGRSLAESSTGAFALPASGTVTVQVTEYPPIAGNRTGSYRLLVVPAP